MFSSFLAPSTTSRSRSKSPSGRERERSRSRSRDGRGEREPERERKKSHRSKYSETESEAELSSRESARYEEIRPSKKIQDTSSDDDRSRRKSSRRKDEVETESKRSKPSKSKKAYSDESDDDSKYRRKSSRKTRSETESSEEDERRPSRVKAPSTASNGQGPVYAQPAPYGYGSNGYAPPGAFPAPNPPPSGYATRPSQAQDPRYAPGPTAGYGAPGGTKPQYAQVDKYKYAQPDRNVQYKPSEPVRQASFSKQYDVLDSAPGKPSSKKEKVYVDDRYKAKGGESKADKRYAEEKKTSEQIYDGARRGSYQRERPERKSVSTLGQPPASEINKKLARLSVAGVAGAGAYGAMDHATGGRPPASPLLEAYKGTYQSISPMPSPLALVPSAKKDDDLSDLDLDSEEEDIRQKIKSLQKEKQQQLVVRTRNSDSDDIISPRSSNQKLDTRLGTHTRTKSDAASVMSSATGKQKKKVLFYDPEPDAKTIATALQGTTRSPDVKPLIRILPYLTIDDLNALKIEYKKYAKINGQGINMSKHIKARILGNLGKVCYATSLGIYESDAFWANCFYQSGASRRELLIESLIGRSNQQIREIKDVFKDKRYDDDLERCMKAELKADKFRTAILLALEERRMPENLALDIRLVKEDVIDLYQALNSDGGESAMIKIIILRSDSHLREVLRVYEKTYRRNFARDMIGKSKNLVGETLAHVLNGALNRPMRDALLLHQAVAETGPGRDRAELLISRLVRMHWDPKHLERVKDTYENRYGVPLEVAIKKEVQSNMKTEEGRAWTQFCIELVRSSEQ